MTNYKKMAKTLISEDLIKVTPNERTPKTVKDLLDEKNYVIDVHTHFFDMHCINSGYFVLRTIKDFLGIRGEIDKAAEEDLVEKIYKTSDVYTEGWNERLAKNIELENAKRGGIRSIVFKLLWYTKMEKVYKYYLKDSSLATYFNLHNSKVITTVLMMDFYKGWGVKVKKSLKNQIIELKQMQLKHPVLPFLFCDPRRADETDNEENLYVLFDLAFTGNYPFFGVKIYPCLGYDPSDYRLWPIYAICEKLSIPVITHCGGSSVTTDKSSLLVYEGDKPTTIKGKNRKEVGHLLNDPIRWSLVLEKFPKLKLNIAHFGSDGTWTNNDFVNDKGEPQNRKETIIKFMKAYDNVYSDFSYTITHEEASKNFIKKLKDESVVAERSMFGSDYWVVSKEGQLDDNQEKFLDMVEDPKMINDLCKEVPRQFLFDKV